MFDECRKSPDMTGGNCHFYCDNFSSQVSRCSCTFKDRKGIVQRPNVTSDQNDNFSEISKFILESKSLVQECLEKELRNVEFINCNVYKSKNGQNARAKCTPYTITQQGNTRYLKSRSVISPTNNLESVSRFNLSHGTGEEINHRIDKSKEDKKLEDSKFGNAQHKKRSLRHKTLLKTQVRMKRSSTGARPASKTVLNPFSLDPSDPLLQIKYQTGTEVDDDAVALYYSSDRLASQKADDQKPTQPPLIVTPPSLNHIPSTTITSSNILCNTPMTTTSIPRTDSNAIPFFLFLISILWAVVFIGSFSICGHMIYKFATRKKRKEKGRNKKGKNELNEIEELNEIFNSNYIQEC